jgi:O-antigen/teichoic acid export membrane protein
MGLAIVLNITINLVIFAIVLLLRENIITFLNLPSDFPISILTIIPLGAMLFSTYGSLNAWLIRKKQYVSISVNKLIRRSSEGASQMGFALLKNSNGLIYSDIIGQTANLATVAIQVKKCGLDLKMISFNKIKYVFNKYSEFPRFNLIPALMSACSYLLPPIFINKYFSTETAGFFDLSKLVLSIPLAFIASSLTSVLLQRVSEKFNRKESFINDLKPVFMIVTFIAIGEVLTVVLFGEEIFSFAFGKEWTMSGAISKIMVWSFAINFIVSTFSSIFFSMRRIKTYSVWQFFYFILILSLILFKHLPFEEFLIIYVIIEVICFLTVATILTYIIYMYESELTLTTSNKV